MVCREARKKLTKFAGGLLASNEADAMREHLRGCSICAELALMEQLLTHDFEQIRDVQVSHPMTIDQIREGIASRERNRKNMNLGVRIMRQVSDTVYRKPRLSLTAAALFILLLASVMIPVKTERPVGYEVAFAAPVSDLMLNPQSAEKLLVALDIDDARVELSPSESGVEYRITPLKDSVKVRKLTALLDSLGGRRVRSKAAPAEPRYRTIWQLLLDDTGKGTDTSALFEQTGDYDITTTVNLNNRFNGDFLLWMPVGNQTDDSLRGLLLDRQGDRTNIQIVGEHAGTSTDDCGWHQYLNNSVMHTRTPDGEEATFNLYDIQDVRKLEKMGYNFVTMTWDTPGQVPIPGMGPKLNGIKLDPLGDGAMIEFMVPQAYEVQLAILDQHGHEIRNLLDCMPLAGIYHITWDGLDDDGDRVKPGRYSCRFTAGDYEEIDQITLKP